MGSRRAYRRAAAVAAAAAPDRAESPVPASHWTADASSAPRASSDETDQLWRAAAATFQAVVTHGRPSLNPENPKS